MRQCLNLAGICLMATLGAYRLLVCNVEHDVSPGRGLFVQSKRALCPKSGQEAVYASENRFMLCIYTSSLSPFSVHVSMECRFSDRGDLVAEATASSQHIHP